MRRLLAVILSLVFCVAPVVSFAAADAKPLAVTIEKPMGVADEPAAPTNPCYSTDEAAAEQLIRLHSQLMVITVTCKLGPGSVSLFDLYTAFGKSHNATLRAAEAQMIAYYKRNGQSGIAALDRLRTQLGNKYSNEAAMSDTQEWCNKFSASMLQAAQWSDPQFQQLAVQRVSASKMNICPSATTKDATRQAMAEPKALPVPKAETK